MSLHLLTCAWEEEIAKLVERDSHDTVSEVEGLLYTVAMVNVYVNVEHTRMVPGGRVVRLMKMKQT